MTTTKPEDALDAAARALNAARDAYNEMKAFAAQDEWQAIETAPKDGTAFLEPTHWRPLPEPPETP